MDLGSAADGVARIATMYFAAGLFVRVCIICGALVVCRIVAAPHVYYGVLTLGCLTVIRLISTDELSAISDLPAAYSFLLFAASGVAVFLERWVAYKCSLFHRSSESPISGSWRITYPGVSTRDMLIWIGFSGIALANSLPQLVSIATGVLLLRSVRATKHRFSNPFEGAIGWTAFAALVASFSSHVFVSLTHTEQALHEQLIVMFSCGERSYVIGAIVAFVIGPFQEDTCNSRHGMKDAT
jgi:hypothetical protein